MPDPTPIDLSRIIRTRRRGYRQVVRSRYKRRLPPGLAHYVSRLNKLDLTEPWTNLYNVTLPPPVEAGKHQTIVAAAEKGKGKSTCIERIAEIYKAGPLKPVIFDALDGGSGESVFWAINAKQCPRCKGRVPPIAETCNNIDETGQKCEAHLPRGVEPANKLLLIIPDELRLECPDYTDIIPVHLSEVNFAECLALCKREGRILVFGWGFFRTAQLKQEGLAALATWLQHMPLFTDVVDTDVVLLLREAGTYLFSQHRIWGRTSPDIRAVSIQLVREARHATRTICLLDSQRFQDILAPIRARADRLFIGQQPLQQLLKTETEWLYWSIENSRRAAPSNFAANLLFPQVGWLEVWQKYCLWRAQQEIVLISPFEMPSFHHREEGETLRQYGFEYHYAGSAADLIGPEPEPEPEATAPQPVGDDNPFIAALEDKARFIRSGKTRGGGPLNETEKMLIRDVIRIGMETGTLNKRLLSRGLKLNRDTIYAQIDAIEKERQESKPVSPRSAKMREMREMSQRGQAKGERDEENRGDQ